MQKLSKKPVNITLLIALIDCFSTNHVFVSKLTNMLPKLCNQLFTFNNHFKDVFILKAVVLEKLVNFVFERFERIQGFDVGFL